MIKLEIDKSTCILCKKCVRVCPADIFSFLPEEKEIRITNESNCISCGHCVAICPTGSVIHNVFPANKVHNIDKESMPSGAEIAMLIRSRRSNRAFTSKPIPRDYILQILDAAHRAPTASNLRDVSFTVVTDAAKLKYISDYTIGSLSRLVKQVSIFRPLLKLFAPGVLKQMHKIKVRIATHKSGKDTILRNAKAVIFFHAPKSSRFGMQDVNMAYQNASLMAESIGVSHFYTGYVCAVKNKKKLHEELGIDGEIYAGMALGIPAFTFDKYIDREDVKVNWIEKL